MPETTVRPTMRHFRILIHPGTEHTLISDDSSASARERALYLADQQGGTLAEFYELLPGSEDLKNYLPSADATETPDERYSGPQNPDSRLRWCLP
jgi:hypothetical protein